EVQHPVITQGTWVAAGTVGVLTANYEPAHDQTQPDRLAAISAVMNRGPSEYSARRSGARTRRSFNLPAFILIVGALAVVGLAGFLLIPNLGSVTGLPLEQSPEHRLIRAFLKLETPTGTWEEIGWSESYANGTPVTRLDFRTENPFGGMS